MLCPVHKNKLQKSGISLVCPRCEYKVVQPNKFWVPELHITTSFPIEYSWGSFTTTNATISGNDVSISTGNTQAILVSPQITNLTRSSTQLLEFTKIKIGNITGAKNGGKILFFASNDGGTTWSTIKDNGHIWALNYGKENSCGGDKQTKYTDLRIKIQLERNTVSDTSPTISLFNIEYNKIPDTARRTD